MMLKKVGLYQCVELWEEKTDKPFDKTMLRQVLDHSSNDNYRIDTIGNIVIRSVFDGSHVYDTDYFDDAYGECAFTNAMLRLLQQRIEP